MESSTPNDKLLSINFETAAARLDALNILLWLDEETRRAIYQGTAHIWHKGKEGEKEGNLNCKMTPTNQLERKIIIFLSQAEHLFCS